MKNMLLCTIILCHELSYSFKNENHKLIPLNSLSGTITGTPSWQTVLSDSLSHLPVTILNPLNTNWDDKWKEDPSFEPFKTQVEWELEGLERADIVVVYFGGDAKAPISLMELGLSVGRQKKVVVGCEEGFWKRGNVEIVCERAGVEVFVDLDGVTARLKEIL
jgi:hypothetical protein